MSHNTVDRGSKLLVSSLAACALILTGWMAGAPPAYAKAWKHPQAQQFKPIKVQKVNASKLKAVKRKFTSRPTSAAVWPRSGTATVDGLSERGTRPVEAGTLPILIGTQAKAKTLPAQASTVNLLDRASADRLVGDGIVFTLTSTPGAQLSAQVDYSSFATADSAGYASRLHLVRLPECALTTPELAECQIQTPLATTTDEAAKTLSANVTLDAAVTTTATSSAVVLAATAAASSDQGDFTATSLKTSDTWSGGGSSGQFTWSYPMDVPDVPGGLTPDVSINYSSGRTDGAVSSTNNQSSWVGEGFDLSPGFIERKYITCADDQSGANNNSTKTGDLCWYTDPLKTNTNEPWDNATLQLAGHAGQLVRVSNTAQWRLKDDDGTRIEKVGSTGSEYWKVTTTDGTQYYFGKGAADGSTTATNSVWSVPVFGNHSGEPSYDKSSFGSSYKSRPWRWNLDYVVAPTGDTMTYYWVKEQNQYKRNNATKTTYDRGGYLDRVEYGQRRGAESTAAAAKVEFEVVQRCDTTKKSTCASQTTSFTTAAWPDVPLDAICTSSPDYCPSVKTAPTFFTRVRLSQVNTFIRNSANTGYDAVDTWDLTASFPDPGDTTSTATLWPSTITHTGKGGTAITLPATTLAPVMLHNRITGSTGTYGLRRPRLASILSETGADTEVTYSSADCTPTSVPSDPATNTTRCFPVYYTSGTADPTLHWFEKYVVTKVEQIDTSAGSGGQVNITGLDLSDRVTTSYDYSGGGAWHYDESMMTPLKYRTWGVWRGYSKVTTSVGSGDTKTVNEDTYFRGMDGDWLVYTKTTKTKRPTVTLTDSTGFALTDSPELEGFTRETRQLTATGGDPVSRSIMDPRVSDATADDGAQAKQVDVGTTTTRQWLQPSGTRDTRTKNLEWNTSNDQPTKVQDEGDLDVTGDETCTQTTFATPSSGSLILDAVAQTSVMPALCDVARSESAVISWSRNTYDSEPGPGTVGLAGLPTKAETLTGSTSRVWASTTTSYDQHGRPTSITDALGHTTTTTYTPATVRPLMSTTVTTADPDGAGSLAPLVTTTTYDPRWSVATKQVQPGGQTTESTLDGLGRVTAVWQAGRSKSTDSASATYSYTVNSGGSNAVTTKTLMPDGSSYRTSVMIYDSLMRQRQTQTQAISGYQVQDTRYTSRGLDALDDSYLASGSPSTTLVQPSGRSSIKNSTRTTYDYAGRALVAAFYSLEIEQWRTTHSYTGDSETVTPPSGGTTTTVVTDVQGRTTRRIQALDSGDATTAYTYTPAGNVETMTDPAGNKWSYTYDLAGHKVTTHDPDAGDSSATYDIAGNLTSTTDGRGQTINYTYDNLNRQTKTADGGGALTATGYDTVVKGQVAKSVRYVGSAQIVSQVNTADAAGRPTSSSTIIPSIAGLTDNQLAGTYTTTTSYNADGSTKTTGLPATGPVPAETLSYGYNNTIGQPTKLTGLSSYVSASLYTSWDTLSGLTMGSVSGYAVYQGFNRDEATMRLTSTTLDRENASTTDETTTLTYDPAGNVTRANAVEADGTIDTQCFAYDAQQQLTEAWTPSSHDCATAKSASSLSGPAPYWTTWNTNKVGKTASRVDRTPTTSSTTTYTYPADGAGSSHPHFVTQAVTTGTGAGTAAYAVDAAGNTTSRPGSTGDQQTLNWTSEGKLDSILTGSVGSGFTTQAQMVYDAAGGRVVRKQQSAVTLYVAGTELTLNGGVLSATRYYSVGGQTVAARTGTTASTVTTLVNDQQGTTHQQVNNATGVLVTTWQNPYGQRRGAAPISWTGERGFVGGTQDNTGLTHLGAREYDPVVQRFISVDPVQDLADPLQWNPYLYSNNTPVVHSDPSGEYMEFCIDTCRTAVERKANQKQKVRHNEANRHSRQNAGGGRTPGRANASVPPGSAPKLSGYLTGDWGSSYNDPVSYPAAPDLIRLQGDPDKSLICVLIGVGLPGSLVAAAFGPIAVAGALTAAGEGIVADVTGGGGTGVSAAGPIAKAVSSESRAATKTAVGFADDAVGSAYQGMRSGGGHAIRHLRDEGLVSNSGSLASQVSQFEQLTSPILRSPTAAFDWRLGSTLTRGFAGEVGGKQVVVFVAKEGPYQGRVLSAVVPDANQMAQWGLP